jgi:hypothetical protein
VGHRIVVEDYHHDVAVVAAAVLASSFLRQSIEKEEALGNVLA